MDDAVSLFEATLSDAERELGGSHPITLRSRHNLASIYRATGRASEAIPLYEAALAELERGFGADHPGTVTARMNLERARSEASPSS